MIEVYQAPTPTVNSTSMYHYPPFSHSAFSLLTLTSITSTGHGTTTIPATLTITATSYVQAPAKSHEHLLTNEISTTTSIQPSTALQYVTSTATITGTSTSTTTSANLIPSATAAQKRGVNGNRHDSQFQDSAWGPGPLDLPCTYADDDWILGVLTSPQLFCITNLPLSPPSAPALLPGRRRRLQSPLPSRL